MVSFKDRIRKAGKEALDDAKKKADKRAEDATRPQLPTPELLQEGLAKPPTEQKKKGQWETAPTRQMKQVEVDDLLETGPSTVKGSAPDEEENAESEAPDDSGLQKLKQIAEGGKKRAAEEPPTVAKPAVTTEEPPTVMSPKVPETKEEPPTVAKPAVTTEEPPTVAKPAVTPEEQPMVLTTKKEGGEAAVSDDSGLDKLMQITGNKPRAAPPSGVITGAAEKPKEKALVAGGLKRYTFEIGWIATTTIATVYGAFAEWVKQGLGSWHGVVLTAVAAINLVLATVSMYGKSKAIDEAKASEQRDKTARGGE